MKCGKKKLRYGGCLLHWQKEISSCNFLSLIGQAKETIVGLDITKRCSDQGLKI